MGHRRAKQRTEALAGVQTGARPWVVLDTPCAWMHPSRTHTSLSRSSTNAH
jgi:hypothetical protein